MRFGAAYALRREERTIGRLAQRRHRCGDAVRARRARELRLEAIVVETGDRGDQAVGGVVDGRIGIVCTITVAVERVVMQLYVKRLLDIGCAALHFHIEIVFGD